MNKKTRNVRKKHKRRVERLKAKRRLQRAERKGQESPPLPPT